ncbi:hypothetical protein CBR_g21769 [Chara braunii]|uniref:DNA helicase n=1 Tax=Chara braunii TaxID=69332 RepID=A0A388L1D9_CHABU|nr:hypothetical protein CBR_g21769 [Chara braunii]|eukprot:GBG76109.1 hypothetical protein CBR_g21769 [Chara braunii]
MRSTPVHMALLEAMEQQSVSVAKAGLVATLSARTAVLAAANPIGGHYNRARTVNENLKMSSALLSRFDLTFILLDSRDELMDRRLSEHVFALHGRRSFPSSTRSKSYVQPKRPHHLDAEMAIDYASSIAKRLRLEPLGNSNFEPAPPRLLQKYIAYARQYVFPRMSEEACQVIQNFYLRLRERRQSGDSTPITLRQLESLVRLAEARARIELREVVTKQDAVDVVEIMKESLLDKYVDEQGCVEVGRSGGMSKQKEAKRSFVTEASRLPNVSY